LPFGGLFKRGFLDIGVLGVLGVFGIDAELGLRGPRALLRCADVPQYLDFNREF
jgi:hypothetical protein